MSAYYNENDPKTAAWLRELIRDGLIANGVVDDRSIVEVTAKDLDGFDQCHFFAGIGGWSVALRLAGWPDNRRVWTGSCPCQPLSCAGLGRGHADERHLWPAFYALIAECRPAIVFGEQVASKAGREWLAGVRADLEDAGYACGCADLCAASVGAPHIRQRLYWTAILANAQKQRFPERAGRAVDHRQDRGIAVAEEGDRKSLRPEVERRSHTARRLGDADRAEVDAAEQGQSLPGARRVHGRLADLHDAGSQGRDGSELSERAEQCTAGARGPQDCGVAHTGHGTGCAVQGKQLQRDDTWFGQSGAVNYWSQSEFIRCRDGKERRIPVERAFFPLVDGVQPARVAMLRGAGNAIVPPLAAEFIAACAEAIQEVNTEYRTLNAEPL